MFDISIDVDPKIELLIEQFFPKEPRFYELSHFAYIELFGDKTADFLQGQLTCDIKSVSEKAIQEGGLCNLQGRILASMYVCYWQHHYGILLNNAAVELVQKNLALAAKFSRINFNVIHSLQCFGLFVPKNQEDKLPFILPTEKMNSIALDANTIIIMLAQHFYLIISKSDFKKNIKCHYNFTEWNKLLILAGHINIYPETSAKFLPHQLHLDKTNFISLNKGCYRGQEIIARMHYLGKVKSTLVLTIINSPITILPGMKITINSSATAEIVDAFSFTKDNYVVLAVQAK